MHMVFFSSLSVCAFHIFCVTKCSCSTCQRRLWSLWHHHICVLLHLGFFVFMRFSHFFYGTRDFSVFLSLSLSPLTTMNFSRTYRTDSTICFQYFLSRCTLCYRHIGLMARWFGRIRRPAFKCTSISAQISVPGCSLSYTHHFSSGSHQTLLRSSERCCCCYEINACSLVLIRIIALYLSLPLYRVHRIKFTTLYKQICAMFMCLCVIFPRFH